MLSDAKLYEFLKNTNKILKIYLMKTLDQSFSILVLLTLLDWVITQHAGLSCVL
jgi:hypothetical protein